VGATNSTVFSTSTAGGSLREGHALGFQAVFGSIRGVSPPTGTAVSTHQVDSGGYAG